MTRTWDAKSKSWVEFLSITYFLESGAVRTERKLLRAPSPYSEAEANRLEALVHDAYSRALTPGPNPQDDGYDQAIEAFYLMRDLGLSQPERMIARLEELRTEISSAAAWTEELSLIIGELQQVQDV